MLFCLEPMKNAGRHSVLHPVIFYLYDFIFVPLPFDAPVGLHHGCRRHITRRIQMVRDQELALVVGPNPLFHLTSENKTPPAFVSRREDFLAIGGALGFVDDGDSLLGYSERNEFIPD